VPRTPTVTSVDEIVTLGLASGLDAVGVCTAEPFDDVRNALESRKAEGLHAGMRFTYRDPVRSTHPEAALRRASAIVVGALAYRRAEPPPPDDAPVARVAAYAWDDHYRRLKDALEPVSRRLRADGWRTRIVADDNALVDRAAAVRAGLGWYGKSSNVLLPGHGSWFVLGSIVTDAPLVTADPEPVPDGCGTCRRCLDGCPTGAIVAPGVVDARRCLSWLLQAPGVFPREHRVALGDRIYGCDDCQEVCPPNRREERAGVEPAPASARASVSVLELLSSSDEQLLARHDRWYLWERDPRWVRRNALLVLGNVGDRDDPRAVQALERSLRDPDPILRAHAVWAARRLGLDDVLALVRDDPDPLVRDELTAAAAVRPAGGVAHIGVRRAGGGPP
jgi:epoxyqueuosine reductase